MRDTLKLLFVFFVVGFLIFTLLSVSKYYIDRPSNNIALTTKYYKIVQEDGKIPDIYLSSDMSASDDYRDLVAYINSHKNYAEMNLYLSGDGGSVRGLYDLVNTIKGSGIKFNMIVYGDVYSAHAVLAFHGTTIKVINEETLFLFHRPAVVIGNENFLMEKMCDVIQGEDRGISMKKKCKDFASKLDYKWRHEMMKPIYKYLTKEDIKRYEEGDDITYSAKDLFKVK